MVPLGRGIGSRNYSKVNMTGYLGLNDINRDTDMDVHSEILWRMEKDIRCTLKEAGFIVTIRHYYLYFSHEFRVSLSKYLCKCMSFACENVAYGSFAERYFWLLTSIVGREWAAILCVNSCWYLWSCIYEMILHHTVPCNGEPNLYTFITYREYGLTVNGK